MAFTAPDSSSVPTAFQPVLNQDFLNSLYSQINDQQAQNVGSAEGDAVARGISNSPIEGGEISAANQQADTARNSALSGFLYNLAGMQENENVITEGQQFQAQQQSAQNTWAGQQNAANVGLGYAGLAEQTELQNMKDVYGMDQAATSAIGSGIGAYAGYALLA